MQIIANSIGSCWVKCISAVMERGQIFHDEDVIIKELLGLNIVINKPKIDDEIVNKYGDHDVIAHTLKKFEKGVVMKDRPFTYGDRIYNKNGVNQFEWIINRLTNKKESKSATICLLNEGDNNSNIPCLTTIDAKIRNNKLELQFFYRSQNIVGRQYANYIALAKLQNDLALKLNVVPGALSGYIASAHIYSYDFSIAKAISKGKSVVLRDEFYEKGPQSIKRICLKSSN